MAFHRHEITHCLLLTVLSNGRFSFQSSGPCLFFCSLFAFYWFFFFQGWKGQSIRPVTDPHSTMRSTTTAFHCTGREWQPATTSRSAPGPPLKGVFSVCVLQAFNRGYLLSLINGITDGTMSSQWHLPTGRGCGEDGLKITIFQLLKTPPERSMGCSHGNAVACSFPGECFVSSGFN